MKVTSDVSKESLMSERYLRRVRSICGGRDASLVVEKSLRREKCQ